MSQYVDRNTKAMTASAAIASWALVKIVSGKVLTAGLGDHPIGVAADQAFVSGDVIGVRLLSGGGTTKCIAAAAIAEGAVVYGRASGQVDDLTTLGAVRVGVALEAATAAEDIIEVLAQSDAPARSLIAGAAITQWALVKLASGKVTTAGLAEQPIGVAQQAAAADDDVILVRLLANGGTIPAISAAAITQGAVVYGRASGKVDDVSTSSAVQIGVALVSAAGGDEIIEVMPT